MIQHQSDSLQLRLPGQCLQYVLRWGGSEWLDELVRNPLLSVLCGNRLLLTCIRHQGREVVPQIS